MKRVPSKANRDIGKTESSVAAMGIQNDIKVLSLLDKQINMSIIIVIINYSKDE